MAGPAARTRDTGAVATLRPGDMPVVTSATGGSLSATTHVTAPGFNPLDLLYASLATCIVLSVRIAAQQAGVLATLGDVRASVTGEKAPDPPSRIAKINVGIEIDGALGDDVKRRLAEQAEIAICTISNTLREAPGVNAVYVGQ